jgi:NDP-sugar pyrophosphorylase family protein
VEKTAVCANGKTPLIASRLSTGRHAWPGIHYSEDAHPRGPAGCLRDLSEWLGEEPFLAVQATAHYEVDVRAMLEAHRTSGADITIGARRCAEDPRWLEPVGLYVIEPRTLSHVPAVGYQDLKEQFLPKCAAGGLSVRCHEVSGEVTLVHSTAHYLNALPAAIRRASADLPAHYIRRGEEVVAHESADISPTARLTGPAWIAAGVRVGAGAVLAGPVLLGEGVTVGEHALVHHAAALEGSRVGALATLSSRILGPGSVRGDAARVWRAQRSDRFSLSGGLARALSRMTAAF